MFRRPSLVLVPLALLSCSDSDRRSSTADVDDADDVDIVIGDVAVDATTPPTDTAQPEVEHTQCTTEGGFGCPCSGNDECLDELCIEGPDGNFCTRSCVSECPGDYACLNTSLSGSDPISICVPRHTRLCRPCSAQADCQSPLDPAPAACVPSARPEEGSFCATSCAQDACPAGFSCEDVPVGETTAKLCRPVEGEACDCRPAWAALGLSTSCAIVNEVGTCSGYRVCEEGGLSACSAAVPVAEVCDLQDEDCSGTTDDIAPAPCTLTNDLGTCPGTTACDAAGAEICSGAAPSAERCNAIDDDCDGQTDEAWDDCPPGGCSLSGGGYVAAGAPTCLEGRCVNPNPVSCGFYTCDGGGEEGEACATSCVDDSTCIPEAHCSDGACVPDIAGGEPCAEDVECATGHCQNGFCCAAGDCCQQPDDCPASYTSAASCDNPATCQGTRRDARCVDAMCAASDPIADDSACTSSTQALDCSPALPRLCSGALDQTAPTCPSGCEADGECLDGFHCDGTCVPDVASGGACDETSDCAQGVCADGVCCDEACEGTCRACDLPGSAGTCRDVAASQDPDDECDGVACTGYYFGFVDKTCYLRAPVDDAGATCDGDGACEDVATLCSSAARGEASTACHADCQEPTAKTCEGTTPGACTNISGGTQTCGVGACKVTADRCESGDYKECVPGLPSPEICDGIDNDCDGLTDAEDDDLVLAPCENQKGVCSGAKHTAELCVAGEWIGCGADVYTAYSPNYQHGQETTCETTVVQFGLDNDCDGAIDDDFSYTSPAGTTIQGAAKPCGVGVCAGGLTVCGPLGLVCSNDFKIDTETCDGQDNDCDGLLDSLDTNASPLVRVACEDQDGVCAGAMKPNSLCAAGQWQPCTAESYTAHTTNYTTNETTQCDGLDNDCDGAADDSLVAPNNTDQDGVCAGTKQKCTGGTGWQDDYATVPLYGLTETPDGSFLDENCDGLDGDVATGVFVTSGGSSRGDCRMDTPCNLTRGLAVVDGVRNQLYMQAGIYSGSVVTIDKSMKVFGGFNASWVRKARSTSGHDVRISGAAYSDVGTISIRVTGAINVSIADLFIAGVNASGMTNFQGRSSYAVHTTTATLSIARCDITAGNGSSGDKGSDGTPVSQPSAAAGGGNGEGSRAGGYTSCENESSWNGDAGSAGTNSCDNNYGNPNGGAGGTGGRPDTSMNCCDPVFGICICCFDATGGTDGGNAAAVSGNAGKKGTGSGTCSQPSSATGGTTTDGSGGASSTNNNGSLSGQFWWPSNGNPGTHGRNGIGGGGGGGSGACDNGVNNTDYSGAGGGGGGAGGCKAATFGGGGYGGGGSFGIFGYQSNITLVDTTITRGAGGAGGRGGAGGWGQPGGGAGSGGPAGTGVYAGGNGGAGARGGHSGAGSGGTGGISYGVFRYQGSLSGGSVTGGTAGGGGSGGSGVTSSQNGATGTTGASGDTGTCNSTGDC